MNREGGGVKASQVCRRLFSVITTSDNNGDEERHHGGRGNVSSPPSVSITVVVVQGLRTIHQEHLVTLLAFIFTSQFVSNVRSHNKLSS